MPAFYALFRCGLCRCIRARCVLRSAGFKGKRGATRGKRPWVFSPRVIRADAFGRMHLRSALPEQFLELNYFLNINIFREIALPGL